eukprot:360254-Chlamydomonas_euryale.AAC.6
MAMVTATDSLVTSNQCGGKATRAREAQRYLAMSVWSRWRNGHGDPGCVVVCQETRRDLRDDQHSLN